MSLTDANLAASIEALKEIDGLGPKAAAALVESGLRSKRALASSSPAELAARLAQHGVRISATRIEQDDWIGQAQDQVGETGVSGRHEFRVTFDQAPGGEARWQARVTQEHGAEAEFESDDVDGWAGWMLARAGLALRHRLETIDLTDHDLIRFGTPVLSAGFDHISLPVEIDPPTTGDWTLLLDVRNARSHHGHGTHRLQGRFESLETTVVELHPVLPPLGVYDIDALLLLDAEDGTHEFHRHLQLHLEREESAVPA